MTSPARETKRETANNRGKSNGLSVAIKGGVLQISVGIKTLARAVKLHPSHTKFDEKSGETVEPKITDARKFAEEIVLQLNQEEEDGTTPVHRMFDKAANEVIEYGTESIKMPDEILRDRSLAESSQ